MALTPQERGRLGGLTAAGESRGVGVTTFTDPEMAERFARQHRDCPQCHPELATRGRDYVRAGGLLGALSFSLAVWIVFVSWLATRWN